MRKHIIFQIHRLFIAELYQLHLMQTGYFSTIRIYINQGGGIERSTFGSKLTNYRLSYSLNSSRA